MKDYDIHEIVTEEMWCHEAEDKVTKRFNVSIEEAIDFVDNAIRKGLIINNYGKVKPI